ncbi:ribonuclease HII [Tissierellia bacterium S5-A11]|nr:ribonuclease HII [Tissierellia bacterium S5-A11]
MNGCEFDGVYYKEGYGSIVGIDEVGRGCLFGDVVACAIVMPKESSILGVKDSKKLSEKRREALYEEILKECKALGIGRVDAKVIDEINIKQASRLAMKRALENLRDQEGQVFKPDLALIDAENIDSDIEQKAIIHGDDLSYSISCASIVAKVYRDRLCIGWSKDYPGYGIEKHKGYATSLHRGAIKALGPSPMHRKTFLRKILSNEPH